MFVILYILTRATEVKIPSLTPLSLSKYASHRTAEKMHATFPEGHVLGAVNGIELFSILLTCFSVKLK